MVTEASECAGCHRKITDRYLLKAVDQFWHEDCLKCSCCDCRLGEVGSTLFAKANLLLCKRDYLRLFGTTGYCSACQKMIPAFEMVMRAKNNVYHLECFACQQCNHRFCVGDRYFLSNNKILCEFDYEDKMMFPPSSATSSSSFSASSNTGVMSVSQQQQLPAASLQQQHPTLQPPPHQGAPPHPPHQHHHHQHHHHQHHHPHQQQLPAAQQQQGQSPSAAAIPAQTSDDASSGYGSPSPTSIS